MSSSQYRDHMAEVRDTLNKSPTKAIKISAVRKPVWQLPVNDQGDRVSAPYVYLCSICHQRRPARRARGLNWDDDMCNCMPSAVVWGRGYHVASQAVWAPSTPRHVPVMTGVNEIDLTCDE